ASSTKRRPLMAVLRIGLTLLVGPLIFVGGVCADPPENKAKHHYDVYGDPLPRGAVARLGTLRWRHDGFVHHLVFSPDDKTLAAGGAETILYEATTGKELRHLPVSAHGRWGNSLWFSPDGKTLVVAGNKEVSFWDVASGKQLRSHPIDARVRG